MPSGFLGYVLRVLVRFNICFNNITTKENRLLIQQMGFYNLLLFTDIIFWMGCGR